MSNQDSQFITRFSVVIGTLVAITILLFALARAVAGRTQVVDVYKEAVLAYYGVVDQLPRCVRGRPDSVECC